MNFGSKILKYREDMFRDMAALVAIPSVRGLPEEGMPFGSACAQALQCALRMAEGMGLATKNIGNYAGHAEYGQGEEIAAVLAHVDVVPVGEGWDTDPFALTRLGNCVYGRGTADDKGAAVAALYALRVLKEENVPAKRRIRVILGAGEETGSEDMQKYFESEPMPVMGFTPDSEYGVCNREKGMLRVTFPAANNGTVLKEFLSGTVVNAVPSHAMAQLVCAAKQVERLEAAAKTAKGEFTFERTDDGARVHSAGSASHAMQPQEGFNAASHLLTLLFSVFSEKELGVLPAFLNRYIGTELDGASMGIKQQDEESGPLTLNLGLVNIGPETGSASIDIRYPVTKNGKAIIDRITQHAREAGLEAGLDSEMEPLYLPADSSFITLLQDSYKAFMGEPAGLYATGGGTYARALKGRGVAFGPFFQDEPDRRLHNSNEHIDMDRFMLHAQICLEAMYRMAVGDEGKWK